jgi:hypothetical protein
MARGGSKPGERRGGRTAGVPNKRSDDFQAAIQEKAKKLEALVPGAFEGDAHALLMAVYKDPDHEWSLRVDAAKAAIRYEKPALSSVDSTGEEVRRAVVRVPPKEDDVLSWHRNYAPSNKRH